MKQFYAKKSPSQARRLGPWSLRFELPFAEGPHPNVASPADEGLARNIITRYEADCQLEQLGAKTRGDGGMIGVEISAAWSITASGRRWLASLPGAGRRQYSSALRFQQHPNSGRCGGRHGSLHSTRFRCRLRAAPQRWEPAASFSTTRTTIQTTPLQRTSIRDTSRRILTATFCTTLSVNSSSSVTMASDRDILPDT